MNLVTLPARRRALVSGVAGLGLLALAGGLAIALGYGPWVRLTVTLGALLLLPGLALQALLAPSWDGGVVETLALGTALSLAALPLFLAWMTWAGGRWGMLSLLGLLALAAAAIVVTQVRPLRPAPPGRSELDLATALPLALIVVLTALLRVEHLAGVLFPAWSDSYQHVLITQMIMDGGRVPANYLPWAEISGFHYHFGFHTLAAFWGWLAKLPAHISVLWMGQVLNALTPVTVYFFLAYGLRNRRAGVLGALIAGLLTIAPASFVNYGRYPQLAAQVLLPVPMALTLRTLWAKDDEYRPWLLATLSAAGLCLLHYRVTLFYACFVLANLLVLAWLNRRDGRRLLGLLGQSLRLAAPAMLLVSPWLVHLGLSFGERVERSAALAAADQSNNLTWSFVTGWGASAPLVVGAALGGVWAAVRRAGRAIAAGLWVVLLFVLANLRKLGLPTSFVPNGAVILALYLPVGILGGYLLAEAVELLERRWGKALATWVLAGLVLAGSVVGLNTLDRRILEPQRFFVTGEDVEAAAWIRANLPADALFAVQEAHENGPLAVHGVDAGLWLPYLTGRRTTVPPMPYNGELSPAAADALNQRALDAGKLPQDPEALARLRAAGVGYAYVVQPRIWYQDLWKPEAFAADPAYRLVYHQGSVWIFALDGAT